jgi:hypothetical protein
MWYGYAARCPTCDCIYMPTSCKASHVRTRPANCALFDFGSSPPPVTARSSANVTKLLHAHKQNVTREYLLTARIRGGQNLLQLLYSLFLTPCYRSMTYITLVRRAYYRRARTLYFALLLQIFSHRDMHSSLILCNPVFSTRLEKVKRLPNT